MKKLIRKGECRKCGACCRWLHIMTTLDSAIDKEYVEARKLSCIPRRGDLVSIYTNYPCSQLTKDNLCRCNNNKPLSCSAYPSDPIELLPGCGYYFEEIKEIEVEKDN